jgi:hypothetical protein
VCPPKLVCRAFSLESKASSRSRADCRSFRSSSRCSRSCSGETLRSRGCAVSGDPPVVGEVQTGPGG